MSECFNEIVSQEKVIQLAKTLAKDKKAISYLSTHAINLFYHIKNIYNIEIISAYYFLSIMKEFILSNVKEKTLCIYLWTHCIIWASNFYSSPIKQDRDIYQEMILFIEEIIKDSYFEINLDAKCEFLVCCNIVWYDSILKTIIHQECDHSLSENGDFIVDTYNIRQRKYHNIDFIRWEHRNVLYIISHKKYKQSIDK